MCGTGTSVFVPTDRLSRRFGRGPVYRLDERQSLKRLQPVNWSIIKCNVHGRVIKQAMKGESLGKELRNKLDAKYGKFRSAVSPGYFSCSSKKVCYYTPPPPSVHTLYNYWESGCPSVRLSHLCPEDIFRKTQLYAIKLVNKGGWVFKQLF